MEGISAARADSQSERSNALAEKQIEDFSQFEREPNAEELQMLELANKIVAQELVRLGIERKGFFQFPVPAERLRMALPEHPELGRNAVGHIEFANDKILVWAETDGLLDKESHPSAPRIMKFLTILHEVIHAAGFSAKDKKGEISRIGYAPRNAQSEKQSHEHLRGFNEGIVESITDQWAQKNWATIKEVLKVENDTDFVYLQQTWDVYGTEVRLVDAIVGRIAETKKIEKSEVLDRVAADHFTGNMLYMLNIDRVFGKGSLRLLAALRSTPLFDDTESEHKRHGEAIKEYFVPSVHREEYERDKIVSDSVSREEYFLYLRRKYEAKIDADLIKFSQIDGKLKAEDPRLKELEYTLHLASATSSAARYGREDIERREKEGKNVRYSKGQYIRLEEYAEKKRHLVWQEWYRLAR